VDAQVVAQVEHGPDCAWRDPMAAAEAFHALGASLAVRDAALLVVVEAYRADTKWSALLLDLLRPEMAFRVAVFRPRPPVIDAADIYSQLVLEILRAAAKMPLPPDARRVGYRIVRRAGWAVNRWLRREANYQAHLEPLPNEDEDDAAEEEE